MSSKKTEFLSSHGLNLLTFCCLLQPACQRGPLYTENRHSRHQLFYFYCQMFQLSKTCSSTPKIRKISIISSPEDCFCDLSRALVNLKSLRHLKGKISNRLKSGPFLRTFNFVRGKKEQWVPC